MNALKVSILVFLDQALKEGTNLVFRAGFIGFNPCFPGSSAESNMMIPVLDCIWNVSILVFLDQALKDLDGFSWVSVDPKFQSLFSWIKR